MNSGTGMQWGLFADEGGTMLEDGFFSLEDALDRLASLKDGPLVAHAGVICPDHPEQEHEHCDECSTDEEEED